MIDVYDDNDNIVKLPTKRAVCRACDGLGVQDAWEGGMTRDEFDEQGPDFAEDYLNGVYNVPCRTCNGRNVVDVFDRDVATPEQRAMYDAAEKAHYELLEAEAPERRYFYGF